MKTPVLDAHIHELHEELDALELEMQDMSILSRAYLTHLRMVTRLKRRIRTLEANRDAIREVPEPVRVARDDEPHALWVGVPERPRWGQEKGAA